MLAERSPPVTELVDQKPVGRNGRYHLPDMGPISCDSMGAIPRPAAKDLSRNKQDPNRVWIRVATNTHQNGFLETPPPPRRRAGSENTLGLRIGLYHLPPVGCRGPIHAGCVALEDAVPVRRSILSQGTPEP